MHCVCQNNVIKTLKICGKTIEKKGFFSLWEKHIEGQNICVYSASL